MCEIVYNEEEILAFVTETVPSYNRPLVTSALGLDGADLEALGMKLTGQSTDKSFVVRTGARAKAEKSLWDYVKAEIYEYFCTKSAKYRVERTKAEQTLKNVLTILATAIAAQFNLAVGVVAGAVTVAVISVVKIGKNAWCEANAAPAH